jgi:DDE superfamily endonuclease
MAVAVAFSMAWRAGAVESGPGLGGGADQADRARGLLAGFREELYRCLTGRGDALMGLADAVLCGEGRVSDLAHLSLVPESGRGHGALYDGLGAGRVEVGRLRRAVAGLPLPRWPDGRIRLAMDVTAWLRPDAVTSPERMFCAVRRRGEKAAQAVPGWPYSFVAALGPGASSWVVLLDAVRIGPDDDETELAAAQLREVAGRLIAAGHWRPGDPDIVIVLDSGYCAARLAWLLAGLPVLVSVRVRANRVFRRHVPPHAPGTPGRPSRHGPPVRCADPATWAGPAVAAGGSSGRHGPLEVAAWHRVHPELDRRSAGWQDHPGPLPLIEGTLIRVAAARPAAGYQPLEPMWLWSPDPQASPQLVAVLWQAYLRRFDIEHVFRFLKSVLGWDKPLLRDPAAADRWTWIIIACYDQLWLARPAAAATRLPWHKPLPPAKLTPGRVRAGFRRLRQAIGTPARPPKPGRPGPGRPRGSKNKTRAPRQPVGKRSTRRLRQTEKTKQIG